MHNSKVLIFATYQSCQSWLNNLLLIPHIPCFLFSSIGNESLPGRVFHDRMSQNGGFGGTSEGRKSKYKSKLYIF